jgi:hypothetical protein
MTFQGLASRVVIRDTVTVSVFLFKLFECFQWFVMIGTIVKKFSTSERGSDRFCDAHGNRRRPVTAVITGVVPAPHGLLMYRDDEFVSWQKPDLPK